MTNGEAVCVSLQTADWALLVVAAREGSERRLIPMIWVNDKAPLFLECARAHIWRQAGLVHLLRNSDLHPAQKKAQLADAVASALDDVKRRYRVLAYVQNPNVVTEVKFKAKNFFDQPAQISIGDEPAYNWVLRKSEEANRAHRVLLYLAHGDSGGIPALTDRTPEERAELEEKWLLHGDQSNWRER